MTFDQDGQWTRQAITQIDHELERGDLRKCMLSAMLKGMSRSRNFRSLGIRRSNSFEGGQYRSWTARRIMAECKKVLVGAYSYGACFDLGSFPPGTTIGRYVSIAKGVKAFNRNHPISRLSTHPYFFNHTLNADASDVEFQELRIGHDVWLGADAIITPSCHSIGIGAIVGAGAVVTKDVPSFDVVVGNPAKSIKRRFPEDICARILESSWWDRPYSELKRNEQDFASVLGSADIAEKVFSSLNASK